MEAGMRIGVISDTHGHLSGARGAVLALEAAKVSEVIHCGDVGSADVVELLGRWPAHFVFGNCDRDRRALQAAVERNRQTFHGAFGSLELGGRCIAFLHGDDQRRLRESISSEQFDLVCYGHTHVPEHHFEGRTLVLNPGALFRANPRTLAIVDLADLSVDRIELP
jgi:uncharacterized protein